MWIYAHYPPPPKKKCQSHFLMTFENFISVTDIVCGGVAGIFFLFPFFPLCLFFPHETDNYGFFLSEVVEKIRPHGQP